jgi:CheY-like chemotaxis protein
MLERLGYRADVAANGLEVIEAILQRPYDVILMDIQMPEMDGLKATIHIREQLLSDKQPYIIAMTANALAGDREKYLNQGLDDYVSKPVRINELTKALQNSHIYSQKQSR